MLKEYYLKRGWDERDPNPGEVGGIRIGLKRRLEDPTACLFGN
jgi:hypothetical protein